MGSRNSAIVGNANVSLGEAPTLGGAFSPSPGPEDCLMLIHGKPVTLLNIIGAELITQA